MTSQVIDPVSRGGYSRGMTNPNLVPWLARITLLVFGAWTFTIVAEHGYTGFIDVSLAHDWAAQVFVDLVIALLIVLTWLVNDAKKRGVAAWPFVILTFTLGSIGPLIYLSLRTPPAPEWAEADSAS